jgi:hypothetical protein
MLLAVSRVPFAWLASIRPDPSGDLKPLTKRVNRAGKEPDLAPFDGRRRALARHGLGRLPGRRGARLRHRHERLTKALSLARRDRALGEREALVAVAREADEPTFVRFTELLAAKESPYGEFLRTQTKEMRAEQNRYLERAADRAHMAMHIPLAPLIGVVVLLVSYGFIHFLAQTI